MIGELSRDMDGLKEVALDSARRAKLAEESKNRSDRYGDFSKALFELEARFAAVEEQMKTDKEKLDKGSSFSNSEVDVAVKAGGKL